MSAILDFFTSEFFVQALGFAGISAGIVSFHMKKRGGILIFQIICCVLFAIQMCLLSAYSGAVINALGIVRGIIYSLRGKCKWASSKLIPYTMIVLFMASGVFTCIGGEGLIAFLPACAMTVQSIAQFCKEERSIRIISLFGSPLWIVYHVTVGSLAGWMGEIFMLISITLAIITNRKHGTDTNEKCDTGTPVSENN